MLANNRAFQPVNNSILRVRDHLRVSRLFSLNRLYLVRLYLALTALLVVPVSWADSNLPRDGLIMHLESTAGVQVTAGTVQHWWDQSGYGQDMRGSGQINLIHNTLNGRPVIELNAASEKLEQFRPSSLPAYGNDRTVFVLSAPFDVDAQIGYGTSNCGESLIIQHEARGHSSLSSGCDNSTMHTQAQRSSGTWRLNAAILNAGTLHHLLDGKLEDARNRILNTGIGPFFVKLNQTPTSNSKLRLAAVLVYNWALGVDEIQRVQRYLGTTYFGNKNYFATPPHLPLATLPEPVMNLSTTALANGATELQWRVSFADECGASNGWTSSRATSGNQQVHHATNGSSYELSCWHASASATANFTPDTNTNMSSYTSSSAATDLRPVRISWQGIDTSADLTGYRLFIGNRPKNYDQTFRLPRTADNSHTLQLRPGTYYLAMSTLGNQGRESSLSGELTISIR